MWVSSSLSKRCHITFKPTNTTKCSECKLHGQRTHPVSITLLCNSLEIVHQSPFRSLAVLQVKEREEEEERPFRNETKQSLEPFFCCILYNYQRRIHYKVSMTPPERQSLRDRPSAKTLQNDDDDDDEIPAISHREDATTTTEKRGKRKRQRIAQLF